MEKRLFCANYFYTAIQWIKCFMIFWHYEENACYTVLRCLKSITTVMVYKNNFIWPIFIEILTPFWKTKSIRRVVEWFNVAVTRNITNSHLNEFTQVLYVKSSSPLLERDILGDAYLSDSRYMANLVGNILVATNVQDFLTFCWPCSWVYLSQYLTNSIHKIFIIIIIIFFHGLGRLTCSGIDALPSFPGSSTITFSCQVVCHLVRRCPRLCVFAFEYFVFPRDGYQPIRKTPILGGPVCLS